MVTGCGALYVTINTLGNEFFELFARGGKAGGCSSSQAEAIGRLVSLAWRNGVSTEDIVMQLSGISCHRGNVTGGDGVSSCADAIARAIKECTDGSLDERCKVSKGCKDYESGTSGDDAQCGKVD
jgi:ribonucleoside-diphosphate reductase alpha chain